MARDFNFADWYWTLDGDTSKVFSSKVGDYVALNDADYLAFKADGNPTAVSTAVDLGASLSRQNIRPLNNGLLDAFKGTQADDVIALAAFKIMFNHENRLRAIERQLGLNGSPANLTPAQARAAIKALM